MPPRLNGLAALLALLVAAGCTPPPGSQEDMDATFRTTNIVPQAPNCNQRGWERLESYCRELAKQGHVLQIACGPHGVGGTGKDGHKEEIGKGKVEITVPAKVWKVI